MNQGSTGPVWTLTFCGDVSDNKTISYTAILSGVVPLIVNGTYLYKNCASQLYNRTLSGVSVWDLIQYLQVDYGTANVIKWVCADGGISLGISLSYVQNNPNEVIIGFAEDGMYFKAYPEGDGLLVGLINQSLVDPDISCKFYGKYVIGVFFVTI